MIARQNQIRLATAAIALMSASTAFGAGYEKSVFFSGKYAAIGGAAASVVAGSQSLFFNPAGLASSEAGNAKFEISGNFSPTWAKFSGPLVTNATLDGSTTFSPVYGVFASYRLMDNLGIGIGSFVSGGSRAKYENVDFSSVGNAEMASLKPTVESDIRIIEHSIGVGYEVMEGLRVGAAWRILHASATLRSAAILAPNVLGSFNYTDLTGTRYNGFRLGAQYAPKDAGWGVGIQWRNQVDSFLKGGASASAKTGAPGTPVLNFGGDSASTTTSFPMNISIGAFKSLAKTSKVALEWTFTRYAVDREVDLSSNLTKPAGLGGGAFPTAVIPQNWKNQHNFRIGYDTALTDTCAFRAGYVLTTQVTPGDKARPTFAAPGLGHTFVVGTGTRLMDNLDLDGALEYSFDSGSGTYQESAARSTTGDFKARDYAIHAGVTYRL